MQICTVCSAICFIALLSTDVLAADNHPLRNNSRFNIERSQTQLSIRGDISSAGHERILRQTAAQRFPLSETEFDLEIQSDLHPSWSLITDLTLQAILHTQSATANITSSKIELRGFTADAAAWFKAVGRLEKQLPSDMTLESLVNPLNASQSFNGMCRQLYAAIFRTHRIRFAAGSKTLSSSAHSLLDEIIELSTDCTAAAIHISGNGDGNTSRPLIGKQRADAVASYLTVHGLDASRLEVDGSEGSSSRKIVFSVTF